MSGKKDDMEEVILHCEDKYIPMERKDTRKTITMKKVATHPGFMIIMKHSFRCI